MPLNLNDLVGIYRSFETTDDVSAEQIQSKIKSRSSMPDKITVDKNYVKYLLEFLFPRESGTFKSGTAFFDALTSLGSSGAQQAPGSAAKKLSRLVRLYYFDSKSSSHGEPTTFEKTISDWYISADNGGRPSAYKYPGYLTVEKNKQNVEQPGYATISAIREMIPPDKGIDLGKLKSDIMMVLVDSPAIDFKMRSADKVEVFTNYIPPIAMSQAVPFADVTLTNKRITNDSIDQSSPSGRKLNFMSPLRFLLGPEAIKDESFNDNKSANSLMYNASSYQYSRMVQRDEAEIDELVKPVLAAKVDAFKEENKKQPPNAKQIKKLAEDARKDVLKDQKSKMALNTVEVTTGMEMFTMPQTLVNLDYDQQRNPRYNPVLNPVLPFATITSLSINITPSVGFFSFKTAQLVLKVFDRSRLSEIAEFLNPNLYSSSTIRIIYGWRAPAQPASNLLGEQNEYLNFINNNMMKNELYGIRNSAVSIDNSGVATVTLELFTKGSGELRDVTPIGKSISFNKKQQALTESFERIKEIAQKLNLTAIVGDPSAKDIRGSVVLSSATSGAFPELNQFQINQEIQKLQEAVKTKSSTLSKTAAAEAQSLIKSLHDLYKRTPTFDKTKNKWSRKAYVEEQRLQDAAEEIIQDRFRPLLPDSSNRTKDIFTNTWPGTQANTTPKPKNADEKYSEDADEVKVKNHPLTNLETNLTNVPNKENAKFYSVPQRQVNEKYGGNLGTVSFGRLFFTYFASACTGLTDKNEPLNEEYQVFFYNLNDSAGPVANLNIAEFPIHMERLESAYAARVLERRGENMTLANFLEIVRDSQFSDHRHPAFGFGSLYTYNNKYEEVFRSSVATAAPKSKDAKAAKPAPTAPAKPAGKDAAKKATGGTGESDEQILLRLMLNSNKSTHGGPFVQPALDFHIEAGYENNEGTENVKDLLLSFEKAASRNSQRGASGPKKIVRIHIYDKASSPHRLAEKYLKSAQGGYVVRKGSDDYISAATEDQPPIATSTTPPDKSKLGGGFRAVQAQSQSAKPIAKLSEVQKKVQDLAAQQTITTPPARDATEKSVKTLNEAISGIKPDASLTFESLSFTDSEGNPRFELVKEAISKYVPTITIGSQGSTITNVNYSSNQDALISTIMMLKTSNKNKNPSQPNGAAAGDLPLRVVPGQLSLTMMGCPLVEYMQQYFIDLGTGTTIDNMYNVIGVTHQLTQGKFTTELKFGFYDAYGKFEDAPTLLSEQQVILDKIQKAIEEADKKVATGQPVRKQTGKAPVKK